MSSRTRSTSELGEGVFYAPRDYTSFSKRVFIIVIDLALLFVIWLILAVILMGSETENAERWIFRIWVPLCWAYLTIVEATVGTLGFLLTRAQVVNIKGTRPSVFRMTFRLLLWAIGPFNLLFDLIWLAGDARRQTLRDTFAGTYVIRKGALPAGIGQIRLATLLVGGFNLTYPEVREPRSSARAVTTPEGDLK